MISCSLPQYCSIPPNKIGQTKILWHISHLVLWWIFHLGYPSSLNSHSFVPSSHPLSISSKRCALWWDTAGGGGRLAHLGGTCWPCGLPHCSRRGFSGPSLAIIWKYSNSCVALSMFLSQVFTQFSLDTNINGWLHFCFTAIVILHFQSHRVIVSTTYVITVFHLCIYICTKM